MPTYLTGIIVKPVQTDFCTSENPSHCLVGTRWTCAATHQL